MPILTIRVKLTGPILIPESLTVRPILSRSVVFIATLATFASTRAQDQVQNPFGATNQFNPGIIGRFDPSANMGEPATVSARFTPPTPNQPAIVLITAKIAPGQHTYSLTQPPGGPQPTKIELARSTDYRLLAPFRSQPEPNSHVETGQVWTGLKIEEHEGEVTWYAPVEITAGVDSSNLEIQGTIKMLVCATGGSCIPVDKDFAAKEEPAGNSGIHIADWPLESALGHAQSAVASYQVKNSSARFSGRLVPSSVAPGESAELHITASVPPHSHIFAFSERDNKPGSKPTLIAIQTASGLLPQPPTTDSKPIVDNSIPAFGIMRYHEGDVTWTQKIDVPKNAPPGDYPVAGLVGYQVCETGPDGGTCEMPQSIRFATTLKVGAARGSTDASVTFAPGEGYPKVSAAAGALADFYGPAATPIAQSLTPPAETIARNDAATTPTTDAYDLSQIQLQAASTGSLSYYIALAFVGGLILNLMPCVLPVIGLKVMSFVEQSGKSRAHAFMLNIWFSAGIIAVFLLLGLLAATAHLTWGGQFGNTPFNVTMAAIVFAMALSLLGVWEVPIPGFFGSGSVQSAASKEGPLGAFLKGVVTTILATPCTAPLMAAAIAWAVTQPTATNLIVFATVGLGMASPYLLIGVYPELLRFLPKPGAWMETFKQISGFVLLGTVIFILSYIETAAIVPTILLLLGIAVACWWVARTPLTSELGARLKAWTTAAVLVLIFAGLSFGVLYRLATAPVNKNWQAFSLEQLKKVAVDEGKTVLVDFSAEWCVNCKIFEKTVLHTKPVEKALTDAGVVTMYADFTNYPPEIDRTIKALGGNGVPVIAVFPGGAPYKPIVILGGYRQQDIFKALAEAQSRRDGGTQVSREQALPPTAVIRY
jgi:suppressor for copper-sensitivity B